MRLLITFCCFAIPATLSADIKVDEVLKNLNNPCGVAVQPETNTVFVSESGAGRVIRVIDGKSENVIVDFPMDTYGKGPTYDIGPLGLTFLDKDTLVVGGGGNPDGEELVRIYTIEPPGSAPLKASDMADSVGPLEADGDVVGEGNFHAVVATGGAVYATGNGDDTKGWIARAAWKRTAAVAPLAMEELTRFIATKEAVNVDAPVGLTVSPDGHLVVGQMGEITEGKDSQLTFYSASTGKLLLNLETGLRDITGLAYAPTSEQLYALDFAWSDTGKGGLFRLDGEGSGRDQSCNAVKIRSLDKPTAIAANSDDVLYVTILGTQKEKPKKGELPGRLLKIRGDL